MSKVVSASTNFILLVFSSLQLEQNLSSKQHGSWGSPGFGYLAERGTARRGVGRIELRVVQGVDAFKAQLQLDSFPNPGIFDDRQIQVISPVSPHSGKSRTQD